jgi:hypothetical protein
MANAAMIRPNHSPLGGGVYWSSCSADERSVFMVFLSAHGYGSFISCTGTMQHLSSDPATIWNRRKETVFAAISGDRV